MYRCPSHPSLPHQAADTIAEPTGSAGRRQPVHHRHQKQLRTLPAPNCHCLLPPCPCRRTGNCNLEGEDLAETGTEGLVSLQYKTSGTRYYKCGGRRAGATVAGLTTCAAPCFMHPCFVRRKASGSGVTVVNTPTCAAPGSASCCRTKCLGQVLSRTQRVLNTHAHLRSPHARPCARTDSHASAHNTIYSERCILPLCVRNPTAVAEHCARGNMLLRVNVDGAACSAPEPTPAPTPGEVPDDC